MPAYDLVVVHPLVLLSVVDHYNRVAKDTKKRVVGILLGETYKGRVDITNCFAGVRLALTPAQSKQKVFPSRQTECFWLCSTL